MYCKASVDTTAGAIVVRYLFLVNLSLHTRRARVPTERRNPRMHTVTRRRGGQMDLAMHIT